MLDGFTALSCPLSLEFNSGFSVERRLAGDLFADPRAAKNIVGELLSLGPIRNPDVSR